MNMKLASLLRATAVGALSLVAAGTIFPGAANASLVLINGMTGAQLLPPTGTSAAQSFVDLGAQGFGTAPRLLTTQGSGSQNTLTGTGVPPAPGTCDAATLATGCVTGADKTTTPTLATLGWTTGNQVALGFNSDQSGQTGITLQALTLTIYNGTTPVGSFSLNPAYVGFTFTAADLAMEPGNGNSVFQWGLTTDEFAKFNAIVAQSGSSGFVAGLSATLGCPSPTPPGCQVTNDGPDTWIGVVRVPGPVGGAGLPGLVMACGALLGLARRRRQRLAS